MPRERLIRQIERRRFLVTNDADETFGGILVDWDETFFVFDDVESVARNGDRLHLDNSLWLPRVRIKYLQAVKP